MRFLHGRLRRQIFFVKYAVASTRHTSIALATAFVAAGLPVAVAMTWQRYCARTIPYRVIPHGRRVIPLAF
jgi:hypothetical protein